MKILTVDDSRMIRTLVRKYLDSLDMEVLEASNGKEGLEIIRKEKPDLVILDVNMPVMDGSEMLSRVRKDDDIKETPVLMLTAESAQKLVLELIKLGISDYIVKPFEEDVLKKKVRRILGIKTVDEQESGGNGSISRILVLDDNESILMVARKFLAGVAEVLTATKPEKALQLAEQHHPQVILLDMQTDGLQTLNLLKGENGFQSTRFVALLTTSTADQASTAKEAGFAEVLIKPFDKKTLTEVVVGL